MGLKICTIFSVVLIVFLLACSSKRTIFNPKDINNEYFRFGSGGGFTGKVMNYYLTREGVVFLQKDSDFTKITSTSKDQTKQMFLVYFSLGLDKITLNDPGNKYYFLERVQNGQVQSIQWGKEPLENKNIETFYQILLNLVKDKLPTKK